MAMKRILRVGTPKNRYTTMIHALDTLYRSSPRPYVGLACLLSCYMDAAAAGAGDATRKKFLGFLRANFGQLCAGLSGQEPNLDGAEVFYKYYRSAMVHTFFSPKPKFAIAEDDELNGAYVGQLTDRGFTFTAVNIDRLYRDFRALAKRRARGTRL